jgi:hypothetical protein
MDFDLQPLRIPSGWIVEWNTFSEADPLPENRNAFMGSSLLYAHNVNLLRAIDLTWEPERDIENGRFLLNVINLEEEWNESARKYLYSGDWEHPHLNYESTDRMGIVEKLETLFRTLKSFKDHRIMKQRGIVDHDAEALRLDLLKNGLSADLFHRILESRNKELHSLVIDHQSVSAEILQKLIESEDTTKGIKNKARQKLNSKAFRPKK